LRQSAGRVVPEHLAEQHQHRADSGDFLIEDPGDQQVIHADGQEEEDGGDGGHHPIEGKDHLAFPGGPGVGIIGTDHLEDGSEQQRIEGRVVGVPEAGEGHRGLVVLFRLIVGHRPHHFGDQAIAPGNLAGDLGLVHSLRRIDPAEEREEIAKRQNDQHQEKQAAPDDDAGVDGSGVGTHEIGER
jgi:hypothetical protein